MGHNKTFLLVTNHVSDVINSRLALIQHFLSIEWRVVVLASCYDSSKQVTNLKDIGVRLIDAPMTQGKISYRSDISALLCIMAACRNYRPDIIHCFKPKPSILTATASYLVPHSKLFATITGLGNTLVGRTRYLGWLGYKIVSRRATALIFQNTDDQNVFMGHGLLSNRHATLIVSSGVDTERYCPSRLDRRPVSRQTIRVLMASRLLWSKGVREFAVAASRLSKRIPDLQFVLAGSFHLEHPDAVPEEWVQTCVQGGNVVFVGFVEDMASFLQSGDIFVFPSTYREGVPRVLLEAAATGLPVVTTDWPGCRDAVNHEETGILVAPGNIDDFVSSIERLALDSELRERYGKCGREFMRDAFDHDVINKKVLQLYQQCSVLHFD